MATCFLLDQNDINKFVEDLTNIIPAKIGSDWPSRFRCSRCKKFIDRCMDDGCQKLT
jgi:hypothetical protein